VTDIDTTKAPALGAFERSGGVHVAALDNAQKTSFQAKARTGLLLTSSPFCPLAKEFQEKGKTHD
jgi:hypothetical protein